MDLNKFLEIAAKPDQQINRTEYDFLKVSCQLLMNIKGQLQAEQLLQLVNYLRDNCSKGRGRKSAVMLCLLYELTGDPVWLEKALTLVEKIDLTAEEAISDFYAVTRSMFTAPWAIFNHLDTAIGRARLTRLFKRGCRLVSDMVLKNKVRISEKPGDPGKAVILTNQLLSPEHAPTMLALEHGQYLQEKGMEVLIVNSCEYSKHQPGPMFNQGLPTAIEEYAGHSSVGYKGSEFAFFQHSDSAGTEAALIACLEKIEEFDPGLILVVGNFNFLSELLYKRAFVAMQPLLAEAPFTKRHRFIATWTSDEKELKTLKKEKISDKVIQARPTLRNTPVPEKSPTRKDYGLGENEFVFLIVGNRLDAELTTGFLNAMQDIAEVENVRFLLVGPLGDAARRIGATGNLAGSVSNIKEESELMALYPLCDVLVNPPRRGGGTVAMQAVKSGLPVLSLPFGDARGFASIFPVPDTLEELVAQGRKLASDGQEVARWRDMISVGADQFGKDTELQQRLYEAYRNSLEE